VTNVPTSIIASIRMGHNISRVYVSMYVCMYVLRSSVLSVLSVRLLLGCLCLPIHPSSMNPDMHALYLSRNPSTVIKINGHQSTQRTFSRKPVSNGGKARDEEAPLVAAATMARLRVSFSSSSSSLLFREGWLALPYVSYVGTLDR